MSGTHTRPARCACIDARSQLKYEVRRLMRAPRDRRPTILQKVDALKERIDGCPTCNSADLT